MMSKCLKSHQDKSPIAEARPCDVQMSCASCHLALQEGPQQQHMSRPFHQLYQYTQPAASAGHVTGNSHRITQLAPATQELSFQKFQVLSGWAPREVGSRECRVMSTVLMFHFQAARNIKKNVKHVHVPKKCGLSKKRFETLNCLLYFTQLITLHPPSAYIC